MNVYLIAPASDQQQAKAAFLGLLSAFTTKALHPRILR